MLLSRPSQILHKRVPSGEAELSLFMTAVENTWVHMRQRRREHNRQQKQTLSPGDTVPLPAAQGSKTGSTDAHVTENKERSQPTVDVPQSTPEGEQGSNGHDAGAQGGKVGEQGPLDVSMESPSPQEEAPATPEVSHSTQEAEAEAVPGPKEAESAASPQPQSPGRVQSFLLKSLLNVKTQGADVVVEMHWVEGQNKDLMNQLCTCLKNTLLRTAASPL